MSQSTQTALAINIGIDRASAELLKERGRRLGVNLTTYARMVLVTSLNGESDLPGFLPATAVAPKKRAKKK